MPVELPDLYTQNTRVISALLTGASNGLRPCLNGDGKLYVPPLPQRRRWPRRTVLQNCVIFSAGNLQSAFVRDASAGGLGLGRVSGLILCLATCLRRIGAQTGAGIRSGR